MRRRLLDRRTLLRGAGGAALALPVLDAMLTLGGRLPRAHGATGQPPRRLIIFFTAEGFQMGDWRPIAGSGPTDFRLSTVLSPLEPIKRSCLFIEGVPMTSSFDPKQRAAGHPAGAQAVLTGAWAGDGNSYGGSPERRAGFSPFPSIDHLIGKAVGAQTRFPALYLGVAGGGTAPATRPFVAEGQKGISPQNDPRAAFDQIFSDFNAAAAGESVAVAQKRRAEDRKVVLDAVLGDLRALRGQLGAEDRHRLDGHLSAVAEVQKKVSVPPAAAPSACTKPPRSTITDRAFANAPNLVPAQLDLIAMALACDLTRVAALTISHADSAGDAVYRWLGHDRDHHNLSHLVGADPRPKLVQINNWHAQQLMYLVKKLQSINEPNGTLFDNTIILWCSEVGNGWSHDRKNPAFTIVGGGQGYFKTGRYLNFGGSNSNSHSRLLQHFMHYMGVPTNAVGPPEYNQGGPLPNITTG